MRKFKSGNGAILELPGNVVRLAYQVGGVSYWGMNLDAYTADYKTVILVNGMAYREIQGEAREEESSIMCQECGANTEHYLCCSQSEK